jgi:hypothetical protein
MYDAFLGLRPQAHDTILDIGVTSDRTYDHSNYLEAWYPEKAAITAAGLDDGAAFLEDIYPGISFVHADGRDLPFADGAFDYVHSSAVLEHVGTAAQQAQFVAEAVRVARKAVFLTTPNRWFPVEFHTVLPLLHWLPRRQFRRLLRAMGRDFFADEQNLNLLSAGELRALCRQLGDCARWRVGGVRLLGIVSNLLLVVTKDDAQAPGRLSANTDARKPAAAS